jgi:phosphonate transport system permease protein
MSAIVLDLPEQQRAALLRSYEDAVAAKRRQSLLFFAILVFCIIVSGVVAEVRLGTLASNIGSFASYIDRLFTLDTGARVWTNVGEWFWGWRKWARLMLDTLLIAYVGTVLGATGAFFLSFLASANLIRSPLIRWTARRYLEVCRTIPELVFALVFVIAFGLGAVPGVLAIAIHTMGALGKLFSEVVENIDMKPVEGAISTGASWPSMVRFAVVPQVLQNFASYALLRFEVNVRGASVMGFVGAGGIGQDLIEAIRKFYYSDVSAIMIVIILVVVIIDLSTERLRHALIGEVR